MVAPPAQMLASSQRLPAERPRAARHDEIDELLRQFEQRQRSSISGMSPRPSTSASRSAFRFRRQIRHVSRTAT